MVSLLADRLFQDGQLENATRGMVFEQNLGHKFAGGTCGRVALLFARACLQGGGGATGLAEILVCSLDCDPAGPVGAIHRVDLVCGQLYRHCFCALAALPILQVLPYGGVVSRMSSVCCASPCVRSHQCPCMLTHN
jgi:hypothetical protein